MSEKYTFPTCWKQAIVFYVPKKVDLNNAANYRPISLLSAVIKKFERILNTQIWKHLLNDVKFGFCHQHSSADFAFLIEHISKVLNKRGESCSVALAIYYACTKYLKHLTVFDMLAFKLPVIQDKFLFNLSM